MKSKQIITAIILISFTSCVPPMPESGVHDLFSALRYRQMFNDANIIKIQAAKGELDPTFGNGGIVKIADSSADAGFRDVAILSDGRIIAAGTNGDDKFIVMRFLPDGTLDSSFGTLGMTAVTIGTQDSAESLHIQPDGKIIVSGTAKIGIYNNFAAARFHPDGSLDNSFGFPYGYTTTGIGSDSNCYSSVLLPDGKIILAGSANTGNIDFAIAKYLPDGNLDNSFNGTGKVTTTIGTYTDRAKSVLIQNDGRIIAAGSSQKDAYNDKAALVRYNADGFLDASFGIGSIKAVELGVTNKITDSLIMPDGRILAVGDTWTTSWDSTLMRMHPDGSLDTSLGLDGWVIISRPGNQNLHSAALQPDGNIISAGTADGKYFLVRNTNNGSTDTSFGNGGFVETDFGDMNQTIHSIRLQSDGKIIAAGYATDNIDSFFVLMRYR